MERSGTSVVDVSARNGGSNPARLSAQLARLFSAGVVAAELLSEAPSTVLTDSELRSISHCSEKRIQDFTRGRACARRALTELGIHDFSLLPGERREPLWPSEVIGSITHTTGFAAAVVGLRSRIQALGVDCEVISSLSDDLWESICTPAEQAYLASLPQAQAQQWAALIFAAKEAFYKCQFPVSREWVGFEAVTIEAFAGQFRVVPQIRLPVASEWVASLVGRYEFRECWVIAGVTAVICLPV